MINPDTMPATRMPVPVADSQFKTKTAASAFFSGATGGTRKTTWSRLATGKLSTEMPFRKAFTTGNPQMNTTMMSNSHGVHA